MNRKTVGIVDYGVGNHTSVFCTLQGLGYRCRVTNDQEILAAADVVVLPGVGAFPAAISALHQHGLADYLFELARKGKPLVGLCLGMQLLAEQSLEHGTSVGLGLIPGIVKPLPDSGWHIGWNSLNVVNTDPVLTPSDGESFYFNHSYFLEVPKSYQAAVSNVQGSSYTVAVRHGNVVGLQFHPEKSQFAGKKLLSHLLKGLCHA